MASARDVIKSALRRLNVIAAGEDPSAEEAADALAELNAMLINFKREGIDYTHAALSLTDALTVDDGVAWYIRDCLVEKIADEYGRPLSPMLAAASDNARRMLQAAFKTPTGAAIDVAIYRPGAARFRGLS